MTQTLSIFLSTISYILLSLLMYHVTDRDFFQSYMCYTLAFAAYSLYKSCYLIISEMRNSPRLALLRKINYLLALSMKGTPLSQLGDQLSEEIDFSPKPTFNEYQYIMYQYFYALEKGDTERIRQLIYKMEKALPPKAVRPLGGVYNELIFYYSWLEKDPEKAERYKKKAPFSLENDMDLNGRRIYAYYLYGRGADPYKIRNVIEEGLSVADEFPMTGNISMETNLLLHLRDRLNG